MSSNNRMFEGICIGSLLGFLLGLLYAPKPGHQLRRELRDGSDDIYKQASSGLSGIKEKTGATLQDLQTRGDGLLKQTTAQINETRDQITSRLQDFRAGGPSSGPGQDTEYD